MTALRTLGSLSGQLSVGAGSGGLASATVPFTIGPFDVSTQVNIYSGGTVQVVGSGSNSNEPAGFGVLVDALMSDGSAYYWFTAAGTDYHSVADPNTVVARYGSTTADGKPCFAVEFTVAQPYDPAHGHPSVRQLGTNHWQVIFYPEDGGYHFEVNVGSVTWDMWNDGYQTAGYRGGSDRKLFNYVHVAADGMDSVDYTFGLQDTNPNQAGYPENFGDLLDTSSTGLSHRRRSASDPLGRYSFQFATAKAPDQNGSAKTLDLSVRGLGSGAAQHTGATFRGARR